MDQSSGAPEILPELSSAAHKFNRKKLEKAPYSHNGKHPGNLLFGYILRLMIFVGTSIIFRKFDSDKIPPNAGGRISVATHINGLVDPSVMIQTQKKRIITLGRHDLITGPVIGWWSRRNGAQPVLRKAEMEAGLTDAEFAQKINHRSMLTVANCLAGGHGAVIMPEGKSHQDSRLHALRTGAARAVLVAAAIANERKNPPPVIQPTGLHWKTHYWFRTDCFVEYINPIDINLVFNKDESTRLAAGEWIEPPSSAVHDLKDQMFNAMSPLTPDAPDWETYRAWKLLAHIKANKESNSLKTLKQEVRAARWISDGMKKNSESIVLMPDAIDAAEVLHLQGLNPNSINRHLKLKKKNFYTVCSGLMGLIIMLIFSIPVIISSGIQSLLARHMAEKSDEGLDARTTYFFLAGMFSPVIFWPITSFFLLVFLLPVSYIELGGTGEISVVLAIFYFLLFIFIFYISSLIFLLGYDQWTEYKEISKIDKFSKTLTGNEFEKSIKKLESQLGLLI